MYSKPQGNFSVSESGGSSSTWTLKYIFQRAGPSFRLTEESQETHDRNTGSSEGLVTQYKEGVGGSVRTVSLHGTVQGSAGFLNVYALPLKGSLTIDGDGTEPAWQKALRLPVDRAAYIVLERSEIKSDADLSYAVRALWDEYFLYLLVEVTDDSLVFTPPGKNGVRYDHLELWFDRAPPWGRMQPDPEKAFQLGLIPVQGGSRVRVVRWFPSVSPRGGH